MNSIQVADYQIFLGDVNETLPEWLSKKTFSSYLILMDGNTHHYCYSKIEKVFHPNDDVVQVIIPAGEKSKSLDSCQHIWKEMMHHHKDRNTLVINLGGGMIGDLGGYAASCYKRGVDFIQIPTTVLSQVDASVGGKTGVNFEHIKNAIGLFVDPKSVFIDPSFFDTLSEREIRSGMAEILKHGFIADLSVADEVFSKRWKKSTYVWNPLLRSSINIKKQVVEKDYRESGYRKILNFGHTVGHAIESYSNEHVNLKLLHGEAVAIGMICELYISTQVAGLDKEICDYYALRIKHLFGKYQYSLSELAKYLLDMMYHDKKNKNDRISFALLKAMNKPEFDCTADASVIRESFQYYDDL